MGALLIDSSTKGFTELAQMALTPVPDGMDKAQVSKPLAQLLEALQRYGNPGNQPTEVLIMIKGQREYAFTFVVDDLAEIQEILQWTIGRE